MSNSQTISCFYITLERPYLRHCMDRTGRFVAIAAGEMGEWDSFDRYHIFVIDTAMAGHPPIKLNTSVPASPDGVGGERFVSMRVAGGTLIVLREERYMHWDGTEEQRDAPWMAFDLASGTRLTTPLPSEAPHSASSEALSNTPVTPVKAFLWGETQGEFAFIADEIQAVQGHRPESLLAGVRVSDALIVDYKVTESKGIQHYLYVSLSVRSAALRLPGMLETRGVIYTGSFDVSGDKCNVAMDHGIDGWNDDTLFAVPEARTVVYVPKARSYLCVIPLSADTSGKVLHASRLHLGEKEEVAGETPTPLWKWSERQLNHDH